MKGNLVKAGVALGGLAMHFVGGKPSTDRELRLESLLKECSYGYRYCLGDTAVRRPTSSVRTRSWPGSFRSCDASCSNTVRLFLNAEENGVRKCFI